MCLAQISVGGHITWTLGTVAMENKTLNIMLTSVLFMKTSFSDTCCQYNFMSGKTTDSLDIVVFLWKYVNTLYMYQNCMKYLRNIYFSITDIVHYENVMLAMCTWQDKNEIYTNHCITGISVTIYSALSNDNKELINIDQKLMFNIVHKLSSCESGQYFVIHR